EKEHVKQQIISFHKYWNLINNGDYYRLTSTLEETQYAAWQFTTKNKCEALLNVVTLETHGNAPTQYIKCKGLNPSAQYMITDTQTVYSGGALMNAGIPIPYMADEYQSWQVHLKKINS
ncbi:MAG: GH36 C-terminal domain-containing protein, partial [Lachnospiraceae bacterium]|nr:GH36 C-terminal domain-containing protein [Lachnospiraceae bacterium]